MKMLLLALLFLVGCGQEVMVDHRSSTTYLDQPFEGVYYFDYGGYLEIIVSEDNELTILRENQSLQSVNPQNNTIGSHPSIYYSGLEVKNGIARFSTNVNYGVDTYDLEGDTSGADIESNHRTDYEFKMSGDKLQITIRIYEGTTNTNLNYVIAERILTSL